MNRSNENHYPSDVADDNLRSLLPAKAKLAKLAYHVVMMAARITSAQRKRLLHSATKCHVLT
jgi:hypothetical protein